MVDRNGPRIESRRHCVFALRVLTVLNTNSMWSTLWFAAILAVTGIHVLVAPYTKVEESHTLHVVYDWLRYGPTSFDKVR